MEVTPLPTKEQHEAFANALALILPDKSPADLVLSKARAGDYRTALPPYFFISMYGVEHLLPAVKELWSAVYGQPAK